MLTKKYWGQHFLKNKGIAQRIIDSLEPSSDDTILEIGPGRGELTAEIIPRVKKVIAVEIDRNLCNYLAKKLGSYKNLEIICKDFLELDIRKILSKEKAVSLKILGNLPYYITSAILRKLTENIYWETAVLTVQKEVAERIFSAPGTKKYGILSIAVQNKCEGKQLFIISRTDFFPSPKVDSATIKLIPSQKPQVPKKWETLFFKVVRAAFGQRRKTLINSLSHGLNIDKEIIGKVLENCQISPTQRAENLSWEDFLRIVRFLYSR